MKHPRTLVVSSLVLLSLAAAAVAVASGEVWRYPDKEVPAVGPALVEIGTAGREKAPAIEVAVVDGEKPVAGMGIGVFSYIGKNEPPRVLAATGADGKIVVRGIDTKGLEAVRMAFTWEAGVKTIRLRLEHKGNAWSVASAPYKRVEDGHDEGSCKNLFELKPSSGGSYKLTFKRPPSIAWCEDIVYGSKKHERELAKLNKIGGDRNVNKGDKNMISGDEEIKMGLEASQQFNQQLKMVDDPAIVGPVTEIAKKVIANSDQPKMPVDLHVVYTDDVNAFVTAGGHIYVFTGLIKMAQNEAQVAGVLAHETSHAIEHHVTEGQTRNTLAQGGAEIGSAVLGGLLGLGKTTQGLLNEGATASAGLVTLKYDRGSEAEADLLGEQYLWKAGWDPEAIAHFFELFQKMSKGSSTPQFLATHPSDASRVRNGIVYARAYLPGKDRYLVDTAEFQALKAKVMALPPPPKPPAPKPAS